MLLRRFRNEGIQSSHFVLAWNVVGLAAWAMVFDLATYCLCVLCREVSEGEYHLRRVASGSSFIRYPLNKSFEVPFKPGQQTYLPLILGRSV